MYKKIIFLIAISYSTLFSAQTFTKINFKGLTQISSDVALETMQLKEENSYTNEEINKAIKKFYQFNYFKNIWVSIDNKELTFHFVEKPFISSLEMTGYKTREEDLKLLYSSMNIKKGTMYTKKKVDSAKKALLLALERDGYINSVVEIEIENINENSVKVKFNVNKGDQITIKNISYKGANNLDESDFEDVIANKQEDCCFTWFFGQNDGEMSFEQLSFDSPRIKDLYLQHGYLDAKVSSAFSKIDFNTNTADIEYTIVEGDQYSVNNTIIYLDESIMNVDEIYPELKLEKDDTFNITHLRSDQEYIKTQVADKGYAFTEVRFDIKPNKEDKTVDLVYNVLPGDKVYINDVIISGNSRTLDRVIRRDIYLAPTDLFSLTDFKDSKSALKRTGYFEKVEIKQKRVSSDKVDLIVDVVEAPTGNVIIGGGYGSYEGWMMNGSLNDKNIFGSGLALGFSLDYSKKNTDFSVSLKNPAINDSKYDGYVKLFRDKREIDHSDNSKDKTVKEYGIEVGAGRSIGRYTRVGMRYELSHTDIIYDDNVTRNDYLTSAITPYINFNNTDDYFLPRSGIIAGSSLKYAGVGGDTEYLLSNTYFKYFYGLEKLTDFDIIFRYKNNLKVIEDLGLVPEDTTFYLGGPKSLRGYESYAFQPDDDKKPFTRYFSNTIELSFPLIPSAKMRWALFYDYGMIGEKSFTQIKRSGTGALISWLSPVGPVQFIFSEALDSEDGDKTTSFEFNLGGKF